MDFEVEELVDMLDSDDPEERLTAIRALGDVGDHEILAMLRVRLAAANKEFSALVVAVDKLKKRLAAK